MRSRTEARVATVLDAAGIPWAYEPRTYRIPYVKGSGYLPDFELWPGAPYRWFIEVKPTGIYDERHTDPTDLRTACRRLAIVHLSELTATLGLWVADAHAVDHGRLLVLDPGGDPLTDWREYAALPWLTTVADQVPRHMTPVRSWWRRLFGR